MGSGAGGDWINDCVEVEGNAGSTTENAAVLVDRGADLGAALSEPQVQLYNRFNRLVYMHCNGTYQPGAAKSWTSPDGGQTWVFDIRQDLRGDNNQLLDAVAIAAHFEQSRDLPQNVSSVALSPFQLALTFEQHYPDFPPEVLSLAFAVPVANQTDITLLTRSPGEDIRDKMDMDLGAVVTINPTFIEYADLRPDWMSVPLAWDRTQVLIIAAQAGKPVSIPSSIIDDLYHSVASPDVRRPTGDAFWFSSEACDASATIEPLSDFYATDTYLLNYLARDDIGRMLSERLVALSSGAIDVPGVPALNALMQFESEEKRWVAQKLDRVERNGQQFGHAAVVTLPLRSMVGCEGSALMYKAYAEMLNLKPKQKLLVLPVLDMRPRMLIRDRHLRVAQDGKNVVFLSTPGTSGEVTP